MHLFPIFPGEDLTVEGTDADRKLITQSIREWVYKGTGEWTGWSYPYGALIAARVRRGNHALQLLRAYQTAYIWPNGFHVNGDYKRYGYSFHDYEPFTMEGECGFTAAVNEMLMQSWGGRLRIFPAVPETWNNVKFQNLRAEGGLLVSAEMRRGEVVSATVESSKGGEVNVVCPLGRVAPGALHEVRTLKLPAGEKKDLAGMCQTAP
jgi:alpha-L-fucosidase 2